MQHKYNNKNGEYRDTTNPILVYLIYIVSILEPLATLPQVYTIWVYKQTAGIAKLSWIGFLTASCIWLIYGFSKKDKVLIISSFIWVITESLVVLGLFIYG